MCILIFLCNIRLKYFSLEGELNEIWSQMCTDLHIKYGFFLSNINEIWIFLTDFRKSNQKLNFMEIRSVVAELLQGGQTDGQVDRDNELMVSFLQLCESDWKKKIPFLKVQFSETH